MPPHKTAKKAAKKAAKKSAHHHGHPHELKDLRRAYEHLGRVELLQQAAPDSRASALPNDITALIHLAQQEVKSGNAKDAADLLRAAEHFAFAALASAQYAPISFELKSAITGEFEHLTRKAAGHWQQQETRHTVVVTLYTSALSSAREAFDREAWRPALEFARAAEALAHVKTHGPAKLKSGSSNLQLAAS